MAGCFVVVLARAPVHRMDREFLEILTLLQNYRASSPNPMAAGGAARAPVYSPADFHRCNFARVMLGFFQSTEEYLTGYLRVRGLNSVGATVAFAVEANLDYDPCELPARSQWTDEFLALLHDMIGDTKRDEDFTADDYKWVLSGLMLGQEGSTQRAVRLLMMELERCSQVGLRALVKDAATHVEIPPLPDDRRVQLAMVEPEGERPYM